MKKLSQKKIAAVALSAATVLTLGASLAYFTDRADTTASGTAGTVAIDLASDLDLTDADGKNILNPGDLRDASFKVTNEGNKSIDVRETIVLEAFESDGTTKKALTEVNGQAEYDIYRLEDVEQDANGSWKPKSGKSPLAVRTTDLTNGKITYEVPQYTLNGSSTAGASEGIGFRAQNNGESDAEYASALAEYAAAHPEVDAERELESGITSISADQPFVLIFRGDSGNSYQNTIVKLSVLAQAKQHRNTGDGTWNDIKSESITFGGGTVSAVNAETTITNGNFTASGN